MSITRIIRNFVTRDKSANLIIFAKTDMLNLVIPTRFANQ